jgi:hypothetical protein
MRIFNRVEGVLPYAEGAQGNIELSRNYHVDKYILELEVDITNAASGIVYNDDILFKLINRIELIADGGLNIKQISGEKLVYNSIFDIGQKGKTVFSASDGTQTLVQTAEINLIIPNELRPNDTILYTKNFNTLNLEITFADASIYLVFRSKAAPIKIAVFYSYKFFFKCQQIVVQKRLIIISVITAVFYRKAHIKISVVSLSAMMKNI